METEAVAIATGRTVGDDLATGLAEIAAYIGQPLKKTFNMHKRGLLPTFRVGRTVFVRKSALDRRFGGCQ